MQSFLSSDDSSDKHPAIFSIAVSCCNLLYRILPYSVVGPTAIHFRNFSFSVFKFSIFRFSTSLVSISQDADSEKGFIVRVSV